MNDRTFRLDFFIAMSAVLISALTAGTLIYQTRVIGEQFAATIWPYLSIGATYDISGETIEVSNDGVGPALVRSAQLAIDGRTVGAWNDYFAILAHDPQSRALLVKARRIAGSGQNSRMTLTMSSIGPSTTLRPGESHTLFKIALPMIVPTQTWAKHSVSIDLCYCSLNGSCWMLHSRPSQISQDPQPVSQCTDHFAIQSNPMLTPARPPR